ncbi:MAG: hypothetical protein NT090_03970 [Acidobacteria bacterium]|nr:hypothetical protein [Acidobacteriota bacterium]
MQNAELAPEREVLQMERGPGSEDCRRGGSRHAKSAERQKEELAEDK